MRIALLLSLLYISAISTLTYTQIIVNKNAGIGFRVDDNHSKEMFSSYGNVFRKHGYNFTFALNLSESMLTKYPGLIDTAKLLIRDGNEMADHTPNHTTSYFTVTNVAPYTGISGVDHVIADRKTICLQWGWVDTTTFTGEGLINVSGNIVTSNSPGEFANMGGQNTIYFNNTLYTFDLANVITSSVQDTIKGLKSFWGEAVNLPAQTNVPYNKMNEYDVHLTPDALKLLSKATLDYCEANNIPRPYTWIQPGGYFPQLWKEDIAPVMRTMGYTSGATYPNPSYKVFNESNPQNVNQFAIEWGDFREDINYLPIVKNIIANKIALNTVSIGHTHFTSDVSWDGYIARMDSLLEWCQLNNIPVYTYSKWADILYNTPQNPYINIFPRLDKDLDQDNKPDGYTISSGTTIDTSDYPSGSIAGRSLVQTSAATFFHVDNLGGIEKGQNYFSIYVKGFPNSQIRVTIGINAGGSQLNRSFTFKLTSAEWQKFELVNSIGDSTALFIPETAYSIAITISCSKYIPASSSIKIADMELRKFTSSSILPPFLNKTTFVDKANCLKWDINSANHTQFKLQRKYEGEPSFRTIAILEPTVNTAKDSMLDIPDNLRLFDTVSVFYRVVASNEIDSSTSNIDQIVVHTASVLPVELISFSGNLADNKVVLNWNTATEINNYGFDIERKSSGTWNKIGFVKGNGNSNSSKKYNFYDSDLYGGSLFSYRLKQIDQDGKFEYSNTVEINVIPKVFALFQNYPNPFNPSTTISYSISKPGVVNLKLFNILGSEVAVLVNAYTEPGYYKYILSKDVVTGSLSSGVYIYALKSGNTVITKKMLLLK